MLNLIKLDVLNVNRSYAAIAVINKMYCKWIVSIYWIASEKLKKMYCIIIRRFMLADSLNSVLNKIAARKLNAEDAHCSCAPHCICECAKQWLSRMLSQHLDVFGCVFIYAILVNKILIRMVKTNDEHLIRYLPKYKNNRFYVAHKDVNLDGKFIW